MSKTALSFEMSAVLCGIDEVGRGPLAGNVVAACVILDLSLPPITGLNDSKKLSPEMREALFPIILQQALDTERSTGAAPGELVSVPAPTETPREESDE